MSGLDSGNRKDYSKFDRMSTESLEELLRLDAELPDGEGSDIDEILYISEVIAKREEEHPTGRYSEIDVEAAWETFQTKYRPFVTDGRSLYDFDDDEPGSTETASPAPGTSSPPGNKHLSARGRHRLRRVVSFAAAAAILLGLLTVTAYAMGYDLWAVVAQWTKDTFTFVSASKVNDAENPNTAITLDDGEYADLQTALDAYEITTPVAPKWIPDRFSLDSVVVREISNKLVFYACGKNGDNVVAIQINQYSAPVDINYTSWQKDNVEITTLEVENCTFYMMTNAERNSAVWTNGPFECSTSGDVSTDELIQMIESIFK